jgi:prepilin-type N-terminal cleavage/methylation domain-containing protein
MLRRRPRLSDDHGFSMIELLVVILIIAILAMIALPAFVGQRTKAQDLEAQTTVRTAATALATHHADEGRYDATAARLRAIEPSLSEASDGLAVSGTESTYEIRETSRSGTEFTLRRRADGTVSRSCTVPGRGRCDDAGGW